jgi:hypothetical protein
MKTKLPSAILAGFTLAAVIFGCHGLDPVSPGPVDTGSADFTRYVALGTGITAGFQSGGLVWKYQETSYPALIARSARAAFHMPLISDPGVPPLLFLASLAPVKLDTLDGLGAPLNYTYQGIYNNLGIPGATTWQMLNATPAEPTNPFFGIVLRDPGLGPTALVQARNLRPTFATVWVGDYDILYSILKGTDHLMTPASSFLSSFTTLIDSLRASCRAIVVANIPYNSAIPYTMTVPPYVLNPETKEPVPLIGVVQGVPGPLPRSSRVLLGATPYLSLGIGIPTALGGTGIPLADSLILDATEWSAIDERTNELNSIISNVCAIRDIPLVDMNAFLHAVSIDGVDIRGTHYSFDYITGGLFSLDGVHLSTLGQYIVANEFIRIINDHFDARIPAAFLPAAPLSLSLISSDQ